MGIRTRYYLLEESGALKRVARRIVDDLAFGADAITEYAGTRQRVIQVLVESEDRKPIQILDVTGSYWSFDEAGRVDVSLRRTAGEWMAFAFSAHRNDSSGTVVDLVPELKRKELHARHRWTVSQEILDRIAADIWPGINGPAAPDVSAVKGKRPRKPPMTWEGQQALDAIGLKVMNIDHELGKLTEPALKGLALEAERHGSFEDEALWRGIAEHAKHRRAILAAHRTGRGEWYAVIEVFRRESAHSDRVVAEAYAKGKNRDEAVVAGRRLMVEKADWLGPELRIDISLYSALEWQPEDE